MQQASPETILAAKVFISKWGQFFATTCPELATNKLPRDWAYISDAHTQQIYYINCTNGDVTATHPHFGPLPDGWILRIVREEGREGIYKARYFHRGAGKWSKSDPRFSSTHLRQQSTEISKDMRISASTTRNVGLDLREMHRQPISNQDFRSCYEIAHVIDDGKGGLGGMNGGVFVVRLQGVPAKLYVEKRFPPDLIKYGLAKKEIEMIHRLKHSALTMYTAAFLTTNTASIYLEFCDRGSLNDMMKQYSKHPTERIPEPFIWHAFIGLADGLAYLQTGGEGAKKWALILHRDIKPGNVLLRSRSTLGSTKYPYCILSDFGLAEDVSAASPSLDFEVKCGSRMWFAPEMLYDPYPKKREYDSMNNREMKAFPRGAGFTVKSDIWSLGAVMFNMGRVELNSGMPVAHLIWPPSKEHSKIPSTVYLEGKISRKKTWSLPYGYSTFLSEAISAAMTRKVDQRPDAKGLLKGVRRLNLKSGWSSMQSAKDFPLPEWSSRVHTYHQ